VGKPSLASAQSLVGILAGLTSIGGAVYSAVEYARPARIGDVVAVVQSVEGDARPPGAMVEVLTLENALVTTLTPTNDGRAKGAVAEGRYVLRASAPRFEPETRTIEVQRGNRAEVRFALEPRTPATVASSRRSAGAVEKSVNATQRFFHLLGL
jgi:Carboxypeptidase regulatory-like domain